VKKIYLIFSMLILLITACSSSEQQYQFPISKEDMEDVLSEQDLDWFIKDFNVVDDSRNIITLTNDDNITFGIDSQVRDNKNVLNMTCFLPGKLTSDKYNEFYHNELPEIFELVGIFYGNKRETDKALNELLDYYLNNEKNYANGVYWSKRVGDDHLIVKIKPMLDYNKNQIVTLLIMPDESYESYLKSLNEVWKKAAESDNIKIFNSTVAEMKETVPPVKDIDIYSKHFVISGHLEDIKEIKAVPESLKNINSKFIMPNKDKYLSAKLVDNTDSINVFLLMTSLNSDELSIERNHNVVMFFYNNEPLYVVRFSVLNE